MLAYLRDEMMRATTADLQRAAEFLERARKCVEAAVSSVQSPGRINLVVGVDM